jgi:hypothetical protein
MTIKEDMNVTNLRFVNKPCAPHCENTAGSVSPVVAQQSLIVRTQKSKRFKRRLQKQKAGRLAYDGQICELCSKADCNEEGGRQVEPAHSKSLQGANMSSVRNRISVDIQGPAIKGLG